MIPAIALMAEGLVLFDTAIRVGMLLGVFPLPLVALFSVFGLLFFTMAYGVWKEKRSGFLGGALLSVIVLALEEPQMPTQLSDPADPGFYAVLVFIIASVVAIFYGVYDFYLARKATMTASASNVS